VCCFGDIFTTLQEDLPIKIAVFDNGKLGFVEIEQKTEGTLDTFTDLKNPDFGAVAKAGGLWRATVERAGDLESAVKAWLAEPGPALLNVKVQRQELVMPPFVAAEPAIGMALYSATAVLHGRGRDLVTWPSRTSFRRLASRGLLPPNWLRNPRRKARLGATPAAYER
jgi:pyruvate dehydrogenase (quinone)